MPFPYVGPPTPPLERDRNTDCGDELAAHPPDYPTYPTTASNVLMGRSSYHLFIKSRSRVIRIFNLPKEPSSHLASLFHPASPHAPLTFWSVREEYGGPPPGREDSVWAVFKSHEQALAALSLAGGSVSVATALESDLEPFQKLRKLDLRRNSLPSLSPHHSASASPTDLSHLGHPTQHLGEPSFPFTLSTNPPNPRHTFRQGDWICPTLTCAAHNFMRNMVCIGCGAPRPCAGPSAPSGASSFNPYNSLYTPFSSFAPSWQRVVSPRFGLGGGAGVGAVSVPPSEFINVGAPHSHPAAPASPAACVLPSPSFIPPSPLPALSLSLGPTHPPPSRGLSKVASLPSLSNLNRLGTCFSSASNGAPSSAASSPPTTTTYLGPTSCDTSPASSTKVSPTTPSFPDVPAAAPLTPTATSVLNNLPSILTPSGHAYAVGGRVQNVSPDPLTPCVMYWPDNEPFPERGQIRPPWPAGVGTGAGSAGIGTAHGLGPQNVVASPAPNGGIGGGLDPRPARNMAIGVMPPIFNTGNRGPIAQQPGDWVCKKCNYLNWRRRKVCQTCFPYAEGNTDGVSANVQAERIAMLARVLGAGNLLQQQIQQMQMQRAAVQLGHGQGHYPVMMSGQAQPQIESRNSSSQLFIHTGDVNATPQPASHATHSPSYSPLHSQRPPSQLQSGSAQHSHSIPTPPNDGHDTGAVDYLYLSPASPVQPQRGGVAGTTTKGRTDAEEEYLGWRGHGHEQRCGDGGDSHALGLRVSPGHSPRYGTACLGQSPSYGLVGHSPISHSSVSPACTPSGRGALLPSSFMDEGDCALVPTTPPESMGSPHSSHGHDLGASGSGSRSHAHSPHSPHSPLSMRASGTDPSPPRASERRGSNTSDAAEAALAAFTRGSSIWALKREEVAATSEATGSSSMK